MHEPITLLSKEQLPGFIRSGEICLIYIASMQGSPFSPFLANLLQNDSQVRLKLGTLRVDRTTRIQLQNELFPLVVRKGIDSSQPIYILFQRGHRRGQYQIYQNTELIDSKLSTYAAVGGVIAGIVNGIITKDAQAGFKTFFQVLDAPHILDAHQYFSRLLNPAKKRQRTSSRESRPTELDIAYQTLGVSPTASLEEIRQAKNRLLKKYHPDKNPNQSKWYTRTTQRINWAYDLIKASRQS